MKSTATRPGPRPPTAPQEPSPPRLPEDRGGGGRWVKLTTARNQIEAHLIEGRLASEGIECLLDEFNGSMAAWLMPFGDPGAPVVLYVHQYELPAASLILHEVDHVAPNPAAPPPRSVRLYWSFLLLTLVAATVLMLLEILGFAPCLLKFLCL